MNGPNTSHPRGHDAAPTRAVTVPVSLAPDEAARDLAPRLLALAGQGAPASSIDRRADGASAPNERALRRVSVVTIDG